MLTKVIGQGWFNKTARASGMKGCNQYFVYISNYKFAQFVSKDKCGGEGGEQTMKKLKKNNSNLDLNF